MYVMRIKYILDFGLAVCISIIFFPFIFMIAIAIKFDSKGPVLFRQKRVGKHKTHFYIYKFRTMYTETPNDCPTHKLHNPEKYITKVGKFLRKTSLDELPQLWNILRGDMSFVGPRPALWNQYDLVKERDLYGANDILPGLTGWAQINGRDELSIKEKAKLDGIYTKKQSFWLDTYCFFKTILSVIRKEGIIEGATEKLR